MRVASAGMTFTLLDCERASTIDAIREGDTLLATPVSLHDATGWELKPEGLCRDGACVPVRDPIAVDDLIDVRRFAMALGRPLALDLDEGVASLAAGAGSRAAALSSLEAPDFSLPDLTGRLHSLSEHRGKKVLLAVYASW